MKAAFHSNEKNNEPSAIEQLIGSIDTSLTIPAVPGGRILIPDNMETCESPTVGKKESDGNVTPIAPKKKRGRPKKVAVDEPSLNESPLSEASIKEVIDGLTIPDADDDEASVPMSKTPPPTRKWANIEEIPQDIISFVFDNFSKVEISSIVETTTLSKIMIKKIMNQLKSLFETAVANGELKQEEFDNNLADKFYPFKPKKIKTGFDAIVDNAIGGILRPRSPL